MKKISELLLLVLILVIAHPVYAAEISNNVIYEGYTYQKTDNSIDVGIPLSNISLDITPTNISGSFLLNNQPINITATFSKSDENNLNFYLGKATLNNSLYNLDIIENDNGLSGLIYDEDKINITPFVITRKSDSSIASTNSKEAIELIKSNLDSKNSNTESSTTFLQAKSLGNTHTLSLSHSFWNVPYLLSTGEVHGTLYYRTDTLAGKFWADKVIGTVAWESGFDGFSITNENETYGHLWSSPKCPEKRQYTWSIDEIADKPGTYYFTATISYRTNPKGVPVLLWDTKKVVISY